MQKLAEMLRNAKIKFQWDVFTNSKVDCKDEEFHFWKQRLDVIDYIANADYTVLLSDTEGLPYTIQESLQYQVPCIVTDVGGCTELIKDGKNGYVVPLNMEFDVNKLLKIPKCEEYDNHALEKWLKYLKNSYYIEKEEDEAMEYLVEATNQYEKNNVTDTELGRVPKAGERWKVSKDRMLLLSGDNAMNIEYVKVVEEIETAQKETKTEKAVKKTTKKKK